MSSAFGSFASKSVQKCRTERTRNVIVFDDKFDNHGIDYDGPSSEDIKFNWPDGGWPFNVKYRVTAAFGNCSTIPIPESITQIFVWMELNKKIFPGSGISTMLTQYAEPVTVSGNILLAAATGDKIRLCWTANNNEVTTVYQKPTGQVPEIYSAYLNLEAIRG